MTVLVSGCELHSNDSRSVAGWRGLVDCQVCAQEFHRFAQQEIGGLGEAETDIDSWWHGAVAWLHGGTVAGLL